MTDGEVGKGSATASKQTLAPRGYFPSFDLDTSIKVAEAIRNQAGGSTDRAHLASFLNYKTAKSGAFNSRLAAARLFGVMEGHGNDLSVTALGEQIVAPTYPEGAKAARVEAFLNVPLFRKVYEFFEDRQLPPESGLQNHLQNEHGIPRTQTQRVLRILLDSAEQAYFFEARGGRSHMIRPLIRDARDTEISEQDPDEQNVAVGASEPPSPPTGTPTSLEQVRLEYVRKLVSQIGSADHDQGELMDRIERLLEKESEK